jgi:hypothetical protein
MADFFSVTDEEDSSVNDFRQSQLVQKRNLAETLLRRDNEGQAGCNGVVEISTLFVKPRSRRIEGPSPKEHNKGDIFLEAPDESKYITTTSDEGTEAEQVLVELNGNMLVPQEEDDFDITKFGRGLQRPKEGIRCAGRKGTMRLLWLHEFYVVVNEGTSNN